jgi:molybdate transport system regulatory protein
MKKDAPKTKLEPSYTVSLSIGNRNVVSELEARMLRAIEQTGSLSLAARTLDLSYPFVWNTISRIERAVSQKIVVRERGGQKGGRAELTRQGKDLLQAYSELDSKVHSFLKGGSLAKGYMPETGRVRPNLSFVGSHCVVVEKILVLCNDGLDWCCECVLVLCWVDIGFPELFVELWIRVSD